MVGELVLVVEVVRADTLVQQLTRQGAGHSGHLSQEVVSGYKWLYEVISGYKRL